MKKTYTILICLLSFKVFSQTNIYPSTESPTIYGYSPGLTLQRNTNSGGYTQGIQTKLQNGDNNWFFGNLHNSQWMVAKGDYESPKLVVWENGNVGIGVNTPSYKLHVNGDIAIPYTARLLSDLDVGNNIALHDGNGLMKFATAGQDRLIIANGGNVGIGTTTPQTKLHVYQGVTDQSGMIIQGNTINADAAQHYVALTLDGDYGNGTGNYSQIRSYSNLYSQWGSRLAFFTTSNAPANTLVERMRIDANGNVGIGTTTPNEKLAVNGKIRAKEIKVEPDPATWPDYVFEPGYNVTSLKVLEEYIKTNKHLPEMPTAKEVGVNGVELGEMNRLLLKKVEELTLLLIQKDKELSVEKETNKNQTQMINALDVRVNNIYKKLNN